MTKSLKKRKQNKTTTEKKNKKTNKTHRKKIFSCQLCGRVTSVKTPPYHRASSPWADMRIFTPSLSATEDVCCSAPAQSFAHTHSDVNRCLYLEERLFLFSFFLGIVIQTTSKHWAQWSLYLLCSLTGMRRRCVYCECVHSEAPGPFISFFIEVDGASEHKSKTWKRKGRTCGLLFWSKASFPLPVNL